ncbi:hypothetical protein [Lysinibacillus odysseyi]|uniref:Uncharacterized protein n=1 Tax=Lysinibacillus odysseyi 34hs-1 = NBRC 100172 TaxID=1220589 RepID=A0A0A3IGM0_9BACI|nr:hypothetical protein [Lysinibacillus odysseyi]KGR81973.1 hypothetical protein CD32_22005 [Lysinibacillus odysseyi 34hs-1 = NBRC 100172]
MAVIKITEMMMTMIMTMTVMGDVVEEEFRITSTRFSHSIQYTQPFQHTHHTTAIRTITAHTTDLTATNINKAAA